jgi:hypothetical protein
MCSVEIHVSLSSKSYSFMHVNVHSFSYTCKSILPLFFRPGWDSSTTADQLEQLERDSFLEWRRQLATLQENEKLLITPFERNLEFWRQLWRVIERR